MIPSNPVSNNNSRNLYPLEALNSPNSTCTHHIENLHPFNTFGAAAPLQIIDDDYDDYHAASSRNINADINADVAVKRHNECEHINVEPLNVNSLNSSSTQLSSSKLMMCPQFCNQLISSQDYYTHLITCYHGFCKYSDVGCLHQEQFNSVQEMTLHYEQYRTAHEMLLLKSFLQFRTQTIAELSLLRANNRHVVESKKTTPTARTLYEPSTLKPAAKSNNSLNPQPQPTSTATSTSPSTKTAKTLNAQKTEQKEHKQQQQPPTPAKSDIVIATKSLPNSPLFTSVSFVRSWIFTGFNNASVNHRADGLAGIYADPVWRKLFYVNSNQDCVGYSSLWGCHSAKHKLFELINASISSCFAIHSLSDTNHRTMVAIADLVKRCIHVFHFRRPPNESPRLIWRKSVFHAPFHNEGAFVSGVALGQDPSESSHLRIYLTNSSLDLVRVFQLVGDSNESEQYGHGRLLCEWGGKGADSGQLNCPSGLALDEENNQIFVVDKNNHRVQVFDLNGKFLFTFGQFGGKFGQFKFPRAIALYENHIFIVDSENFRVQVFSKQGSFIFAFSTSDVGDISSSSSNSIHFPTSITICERQIYVGFNKLGLVKSFKLSEAPQHVLQRVQTENVDVDAGAK